MQVEAPSTPGQSGAGDADHRKTASPRRRGSDALRDSLSARRYGLHQRNIIWRRFSRRYSDKANLTTVTRTASNRLRPNE